MKKVLLLGIVVLALAGCSNNADTKDDGTLGGAYSNAGGWVKLPDNRQVMCVAYGKGGVSCDWEHIKNG